MHCNHLPSPCPGAGCGGGKAPSSMGKISIAEVLRLRATSAVSRDKSVRRSAQDDDSAEGLTKNTLNKLALLGRATREPGAVSPRNPGLSIETWGPGFVVLHPQLANPRCKPFPRGLRVPILRHRLWLPRKSAITGFRW